MKQEDIIRMAREAGMQTVFAVIEEHQDGTQTVIDHRPFLERFANLVAAAELRRLHEVNQMLVDAADMALEWVEAQKQPRMIGSVQVIQALRQALAKAKEQA